MASGEEQATAEPSLEETAAWAETLYAGAADKAGAPMAAHARRVAEQLSTLFPQALEAERHAAWLHDVLEDGHASADEIAARGYSARVIELVEAVSRRRDLTYQNWIDAIAASGDAGAIRIKLADLSDNLDPERLAALPQETAARLSKRYARAQETLLAALSRLT
ncbi:MAG: HD domain-containing protein [Pseudomonadota bacterium]